MAGVFFVSDTHFSHDMVARIRGFDTTEDHDEHLIQQWNTIVTKREHSVAPGGSHAEKPALPKAPRKCMWE